MIPEPPRGTGRAEDAGPGGQAYRRPRRRSCCWRWTYSGGSSPACAPSYSVWAHLKQIRFVCPARGPSVIGFGCVIFPPQWRHLVGSSFIPTLHIAKYAGSGQPKYVLRARSSAPAVPSPERAQSRPAPGPGGPAYQPAPLGRALIRQRYRWAVRQSTDPSSPHVQLAVRCPVRIYPRSRPSGVMIKTPPGQIILIPAPPKRRSRGMGPLYSHPAGTTRRVATSFSSFSSRRTAMRSRFSSPVPKKRVTSTSAVTVLWSGSFQSP